jgi:hypothetical protein
MGGRAMFNFVFYRSLTLTYSVFYNSMGPVEKCSEAHKNVLLNIVCFFCIDTSLIEVLANILNFGFTVNDFGR